MSVDMGLIHGCGGDDSCMYIAYAQWAFISYVCVLTMVRADLLP